MIRSLATAAAALLTAGCVSVLPEAPPPAPRYAIADVERGASAGEAVNYTLAIDDMQATRAIDNTRIARVADGEYVYYAGGEWADRAPRLFGVALVRSFQNSGRILGVGARASMPVSDYILMTDLRAFEARPDKGETATRVEVYARLTDYRGRVKAARVFTAASPVAVDGAKAAAAALDRDAGRIIAEMVDWALAEGAADAAARAAQAK